MIAAKHDNNGADKRHISPDRFFSADAEKTKLNWFLFEFALELEQFIACRLYCSKSSQRIYLNR